MSVELLAPAGNLEKAKIAILYLLEEKNFHFVLERQILL